MDGFISHSKHMDRLSYGIRCAKRQIRTSSHQLQIKTRRNGSLHMSIVSPRARDRGALYMHMPNIV
eukprot:c4564_g2_i1 orf=163-360(-)